MSVPQRIYKYQPFSEQAIQNLKDQVIYFGSPLNFNDAYDCKLPTRIKDLTDADIKKICSHYLEKPGLTDIQRRILGDSTPADRSTVVLPILEILEINRKAFLSTRGVSCFSETNKNLLMWAHYSGSSTGFCLEFQTDQVPFGGKLRKVNYTNEMPAIDLVSMICDANADEYLNLYCTKALVWKYEQEWRCIHNDVGTKYVYNPESLTGVYLGSEMSNSAIETIALILQGHNAHVKLYKGSLSKTEFAVKFDPFECTSNLEAKRQDLR